MKVPGVSVVVPTYRRPADLSRCLDALDRQRLPASEVIVVARHDDHATHALLQQRENGPGTRVLRVVPVQVPGVVAAYNRGLDSASHAYVCFTDDDAAPHPDWIERLVAALDANPRAGGVGGRDIVHERGGILEGERPLVGLVRWYGRHVGNHHLGCGGARNVHVLKAVNMAFRQQATEGVRFDERLRGSGAQVHCEMKFCLEVLRRGWELVYDPSIRVEHYPAARADDDQRFRFNRDAFYNASFNLRLIMREHLSLPGRWAFIVYAALIGNRADPGLVRAITLTFDGVAPKMAFCQWLTGLRALRGAWQEAKR